MSELGLFLIIGLFVAGAVLMWWTERKLERERTARLAQVARRMGWLFDADGEDGNLRRRHEQFACFQKGHTRFAHNRMTGLLKVWNQGLEVEVGDYHYKITRSNGKSSSTTTYRFSYMLVELPFGPRLPAFALRPEGLFDKLAGAVGFEDIDFESAEFSRRYHVSGTDRRFVYDLLHPRMIEWILDDPPPQFEVRDGVLLMLADGGSSRWEPEEFQAALNWGARFLAGWPDYLVRDLNTR